MNYINHRDYLPYAIGLIKKHFKFQLMGVTVENQYGGPQANFFSLILALEELAKVDFSISITVDIQNLVTGTLINRLGTDAQKRYFLPQLTSGKLGAFCMSERNSGSDAFAMTTQATRQGDSYYLNGNKLWISNAAHADLFIVMANANPEKVRRHNNDENHNIFRV